ncbi:hypothetical protein E3P99_00989 [Wallemia hederae]|uniref:Carbohydrate kinase FGGY C-terminal domain-containing protein n=1 Tax=Wallemia hederae TaxID=1540922 RepID=A0A4T0FSS3_9BASI|nr:hypothetical protein E3P99_00989 [Wallemia hederae]
MIAVVNNLDLVVIGSDNHRILLSTRYSTPIELFTQLDGVLREWDVDILSVDAIADNTATTPTSHAPSTPLHSLAQLHDPFYLRQRYSREFEITANLDRTPAHLIAISPPSNSILLGLGHDDHLVFQIPKHARLDSLPRNARFMDHPLNPALLLAHIQIHDQGNARSSIRDAYSNGNWATFNSLVNIVNIGGSVGLDNKLFSFYYPSSETTLSGPLQGYYRYELGVSTNEFADLRANPRCIIESQFLTIKRYIDEFERAGLVDENTTVYLTGEPTQSGSLCSAIANILNRRIYLPHSTMGERSTHHTLTPLLGMGLYSWYKTLRPSTSLEETVRYRRKAYNHSITSPASTPPLTPLLTPQIGSLNTIHSKSNLTPVDEQFELPTITPTTVTFDQRYAFNTLTTLEFDNDPYIKPDKDMAVIYNALVAEHKRLEAVSVGCGRWRGT